MQEYRHGWQGWSWLGGVLIPCLPQLVHGEPPHCTLLHLYTTSGVTQTRHTLLCSELVYAIYAMHGEPLTSTCIPHLVPLRHVIHCFVLKSRMQSVQCSESHGMAPRASQAQRTSVQRIQRILVKCGDMLAKRDFWCLTDHADRDII